MDPVEEYAQLKQQITRLQARFDRLRDSFLQPGARLHSNQTEIVVRLQTSRFFLKDKLPAEILHNPAFLYKLTINKIIIYQQIKTHTKNKPLRCTYSNEKSCT